MLNSNGEFTIDLYLSVGDNQIIMNAADTKMNVSINTFTITRKLEELITAGKYYALIIGIDDYNGVWTPLKNAVNDAKAVEGLLSSEYNFDEIIPLYNGEATRKNIIQRFEQLAAKVTKDDNVIIFYSGHSEFKQQLNKGCWVPVDAASRSTADYISNSIIFPVTNNSEQTPVFQPIKNIGDEGGQFIFVKKK